MSLTSSMSKVNLEVDSASAESLDVDLEATHTKILGAIAQLTAGDFHNKWNNTKLLSSQFVEWGNLSIPPLIAHLQTESNPENQCFLIRVLGQFNSPAAIKAIAQQLIQTADLDVQTAAIKALTSLGDSAIETLAALLQSPDLAQQQLAARTLSRIRRTAVIEPLLGIANHADTTLRAIALEALGSFHDPRITPVLISATEDDPAISKEAIRALSRRSDLLEKTDLVSPLSRTLRSADLTVAKESAIALGRLGTPDAVCALSTLLSRPRPTAIKVAAARALGWIGTAPAVEALAEAFSYGPPVIMPDTQQEIARSLSQVQADGLKAIACEPLVCWLSDCLKPQPQLSASQTPVHQAHIETFALKQTIISALSRLKDSIALDSLVRSLVDPDPRIRVHVLSALKQIDPRAAQTKIQNYLTSSDLSSQQRQLIKASLSAW